MSAGTGLQLEVTAGPATGVAFTVDERLVIGRLSDGHGRLGDDPELSRHHAEIARQPDGTFAVEDLGSTNGTILNGTRIAQLVALTTGDSIEVGSSSLLVTYGPAPGSSGPPPVEARATTVIVETTPEMRAAGAPPPTPPAPPPPSPVPAPPELPAAAEAPTPTPRLELRVVVDPDNGEAEIHFDDASEPIRLSHRDGRWQNS